MVSVLDLLRTLPGVEVIERAAYRDGQATPTGPQIIYQAGEQSPTDRRYSGTTRHRRVTHLAVCVSNTCQGASLLASRVMAAVDGAPAPSGLYTVTWASEPVEDRDDPSVWRWSSTVNIVEFQTM